MSQVRAAAAVSEPSGRRRNERSFVIPDFEARGAKPFLALFRRNYHNDAHDYYYYYSEHPRLRLELQRVSEISYRYTISSQIQGWRRPTFPRIRLAG